jgi:hypothetical protein
LDFPARQSSGRSPGLLPQKLPWEAAAQLKISFRAS